MATMPRRMLAGALFLTVLVLGCGKSEETPAAKPAPEQAAAPAASPGGADMIAMPAGEFAMGDDAGEADERPAHTVRLAAFSIDGTEVTQKSYEELMGTNPSKFRQPERPVEQVSWFNAIKYCNMRSLRDGLTPCYDLETQACDFGANGYRLPTEAEWEYACRAGTRSRYSFGNDAGGLSACAWFKRNAEDQTHPVAARRPNPWGLYDMHGNVAEWCHDVYSEGYYAQSPAENPTGPAAGEDRVLRGGSWAAEDDACRSSARYSDAPGFADVCFGYDAYGFRCVRRASGAAE